jgi:hypothetical protein
MTVSLEVAWSARSGVGLVGGEGFVLQKVTGPGVVWLELSGEVVEKDLAPGEKLLVNLGHIAVQTAGVAFDLRRVSGFRNTLFGGEGLFLATLTGPGHVWLQSMPVMNLAAEVGRYLPLAGAKPQETAPAAAASTPAVSPPPAVSPAPAAGGSAANTKGSTIDDAALSVGDAAAGLVDGFIGLFGGGDIKRR